MISASEAPGSFLVGYLITSDNTSYVEGMPEVAALDSDVHAIACDVFLCKGLQFADNVTNLQTDKAGQVVDQYTRRHTKLHMRI
jgi:uncharacterized protein YhbP (UPF0306 family)